MSNSESAKLVARTCRLCGTPISGPAFAHAPEGYCCEGCLLADRKQRVLTAAADDASFALAEALAEALDAREHATGLHSKRVAGHTR